MVSTPSDDTLLMVNDYKRPEECDNEWDRKMAEVLILLHQMFLDEEAARRKSRKRGNALNAVIES